MPGARPATGGAVGVATTPRSLAPVKNVTVGVATFVPDLTSR